MRAPNASTSTTPWPQLDISIIHHRVYLLILPPRAQHHVHVFLVSSTCSAYTQRKTHARHIFSCHIHILISSYLRTSASNMYVFQVGARSTFSTMRDFINLIAHVECIEILLLKLINRTRNCTYLCLLDVVTFWIDICSNLSPEQ
jgi:hypothetical protein